MKAALTVLLFPLLAPALLAQRPWQEVTVPTVSQAAANFKAPPHEYGAIQAFTSWNGADQNEVKQRIVADLDRMVANGNFIFNLSPGRSSPGEPAYLSPGHMELVKFIVAEAAKRNMRLWIQDESDYPSGFAGGYISERYPQLGMQVMAADISVRAVTGQTLQMVVPPDTLAIWAAQNDGTVVPIPVPADGQLKYQAPVSCQIKFLRHIYLSSPTRNFNRADGTRAKNATYSLIDYLDPKATDAFLSIVHETYRGAVGDQFGKIVLGFFGDEPDYSENNTTGSPIVPGSAGVPWTPTLLEQFKAQKGYDLTPYLPAWFDGQQTEQSRRAWADYYDVWSGIFRGSFFGEQADWAKAHNVEYLVHLNHEEAMLSLEASEGDYFRDERFVQVPGIDNLSQLIPSAVHRFDSTWGTNNNFPKLASSDAHLFGKPKVWAEEGGGSGVDGKYQMNFQLVRGVMHSRSGSTDCAPTARPILRAASAGHPADPLVRKPRRLSHRHWPARGAGRSIPPRQHHLAWRRRRHRSRPQHHQTRLAIIRAPGRLGLLRRAVPQFGRHHLQRGVHQSQRPDLQSHRPALDDRHHPDRPRPPARLRQGRRQGHLCRQNPYPGHRQDLPRRQGGEA